ncbi:9601_t:CDS:2, partial [Gigaspora rosea]
LPLGVPHRTTNTNVSITHSPTEQLLVTRPVLIPRARVYPFDSNLSQLSIEDDLDTYDENDVLDVEAAHIHHNRLIEEELQYNVPLLERRFAENFSLLNIEQQTIFNAVILA